jgi:diguanylate cyclase (GGDEF)-like protein/PAS domain S-box-containing protein
MYLSFAALIVAVTLQGWNTLRLEAVRAADAELLDQAGLQRTLAQQVGREAALLVPASGAARAAHVQTLDWLMRQSAEQALQMDMLLSAQIERSPAGRPMLAALDGWQATRVKLWYRGELLLRQAEVSNEEAVRRSAAVLQDEVAPALAAAQALSSQLRSAAEERARGLTMQVRWGIVALLLLLAALSLGVVEPTARAVRRHARRLREQATELQRLALVAEHTTALVIISDSDDLIVWANRAFEQITGWPLAEAVGRRPGELLGSPHADESVLAQVHEALRSGLGARHEWLHRAREGRELWLDVDLRPLRDEAGRLQGHVRVCTDVSLRVQQQAKLQALWAALPAGVVVQAPGGEIVEANRAAERLLGLSLAQMQGHEPGPTGHDVEAVDAIWRTVREDGSPYPRELHPSMRTLRTGEALRNETIGIHTPAGVLRWLLVNTEPQRDHQGQLAGVLSCFSDVTEARALHDRLATIARTDTLTQLPNRAVVMDRLQRVIAHAQRTPGYGFAVLFMDFDRFKQVNDTLGHAAGDELLRQIAQRLMNTLRPGDAVARMDAQVAARLGGDEFVVVLEGVNSAASAAAIASRLLEELAEPYLIAQSPVRSSASIGIVLCTGLAGGTTPPSADEVLRNADTAMYEAKRAGRARWVLFDDSMHERVVRALAMEADLRRALQEDELFVVYQPVVDLAHRAMVGVEALVRWRHPQRGLVSPVEFIGVAEEAGLIDELGAQVLQRACGQFMMWQQTLGDNAPRSLAVNLSRAQLKRAALVDDVRAVLAAHGMPPAMLQLEVTESLAAQDERVQSTLRELKNLGVRLALDDFGTGYSSLACLHQMPVDTVKVDRSFIKHAETVEYHRVLIEATIRVARTLGMITVAEGIETEGQADLMLALECDRGQGYLFARPLEAAELEAWAREHARDPVDTA